MNAQVRCAVYSPGSWLPCCNDNPVGSEMRRSQVTGSTGYRQSVQSCVPLGVVVMLEVKQSYFLLKSRGQFYSVFLGSLTTSLLFWVVVQHSFTPWCVKNIYPFLEVPELGIFFMHRSSLFFSWCLFLLSWALIDSQLPSQSAKGGAKPCTKSKSTSFSLLAIPAFDSIAGLYNIYLNSNRVIRFRYHFEVRLRALTDLTKE